MKNPVFRGIGTALITPMTPDGRIDYAKRCAEILQKVDSPVEIENYLQMLSIQTGFPRETLIMQMGIKMPSVPAAPSERAKPVARRSVSPSAAIPMQEKTLIALLASGMAPDNTIHTTDFDHPLLRSLAEALLQGKPMAAIIAECEDDTQRQQISEMFVLNADIREDNATSMVEECLTKIRIARLQTQIDEINTQLPTLEAEEKTAALKELLTLSSELARIKRAVH